MDSEGTFLFYTDNLLTHTNAYLNFLMKMWENALFKARIYMFFCSNNAPVYCAHGTNKMCGHFQDNLKVPRHHLRCSGGEKINTCASKRFFYNVTKKKILARDRKTSGCILCLFCKFPEVIALQ